MSKTKNIVIDDLNNSRVMENRDYVGTDREFMEILHSTFPDGVEYAKKALNKALELSEASVGFYRGMMLNDYGIYPFLKAHSAEYEEDGLFSMQIIFRSEIDKEMLEEWIKGLSLSVGERTELISDVRQYYKMSSGKLDMCYLDAMNYLIQVLKCHKERYEVKKGFIDALFGLAKDYSHVVTFNSVITKDFLWKKIRRFNEKKGKKTGKFFIMHPYPELENRSCIVSCVPYKRK